MWHLKAQMPLMSWFLFASQWKMKNWKVWWKIWWLAIDTWKGGFCTHCSLEDCKGVADHCFKYTLSDPTEKLCKSDCNYSSHENSCNQCESLSDALSKITPLVTKHKQGSPNEEQELKYDINRSTKFINLWKAHILATINQEHAKKELLVEMDENTAFVVIDFAMKFLSRRYHESMAN